MSRKGLLALLARALEQLVARHEPVDRSARRRMRKAARQASRSQRPQWLEGHDVLSDLWDDLFT